MLKMSSSSSPSTEKTWFQDTKTGCEKQAHYFVQIRRLQDELIHREQHNLINAMERLKQLTYPRKRPVVRNVDTSDPRLVQNFPVRNLNLRKEAKHKAIPGKEKPELNPLSGKPLMSKPEHKKNENYHHFFLMPPLLSDRDIAKIVYHANATFPSQPSTYLLQPHLPSIPNVGRKTNFMVDNRLKLLTLAEPEFCDPEEGSVSGTRKHLHTGKSKQRKKSGAKSKLRLDGHASKGNLSKKSGNVLTFDVDPNDPSLFSHCVGEKKEEEQYETTPLPPPNSRPSSTKSKLSQALLEVAVQDDSSRVETIKDGGSVNKQSDTVSDKGQSSQVLPEVAAQDDRVETLKDSGTVNKQSHTVNDEVAKIDEENCVASVNIEITDSSKESGNVGVNPDGDQISPIKNIMPAEGTQGGSEVINDNQEPVEIVQPTVTIINKPVTSEGDESIHENFKVQ